MKRVLSTGKNEFVAKCVTKIKFFYKHPLESEYIDIAADIAKLYNYHF